ncbi:MAG: hypothetical protein IMZ43_00875 [Thermoplasmata archaeon]|nr:hypothetical protein [Thermoplasmata archaeon]MBE3140390.1 hypothetical protein [Thermoplasmata archaeon]
MKKGLLAVLVVVICASATLSGCQDTSSIKTQQRPQNVFLDSTIVEFANVTFEKNINKSGGIEAVTVGWLFHNIAGKLISAKIDVKFFDKNNIFLYNDSRWIYYMPAGHTEKSFSPGANRVTYEGAGVAFVDHVVISVTEI